MDHRLGENTARVLSGISLLLLVAASEKLCPTLCAGPARPPVATPEGQPAPRSPVTFVSALPDAPAAPRSTPPLRFAAVRETQGWRDGVTQVAPVVPPAAAGAASAAGPIAWPRLVALLPPPGAAPRPQLSRGCICPTGPPAA